MDCFADLLLANAKCLCGIPEGRKMDVLISLFANIAEVPVNAKQLLSDAKCLCLPEGRQMDVLISLACQILNAGGAAKVCILGGVGPPAVSVPCNFSAYVEQPGPNFGLWLGDSISGWQQVIVQGP